MQAYSQVVLFDRLMKTRWHPLLFNVSPVVLQRLCHHMNMDTVQ